MTVDAGETCRANQMWFPGTTGIGLHLGITAFRSKAQIRHIYLISMLPYTHQEVHRLDISMDDALRMDSSETTNELVSEHQYCFEGELAAAKVEKVFQTRPQEIKHHSVVFAFRLI